MNCTLSTSKTAARHWARISLSPTLLALMSFKKAWRNVSQETSFFFCISRNRQIPHLYSGKNKIKITYGTKVLPHMLASFIALCNSFEDNIVEDLQIQDLLEAWSLLGVLVPAALDKLSEFLGARVGNLRSFVSVWDCIDQLMDAAVFAFVWPLLGKQLPKNCNIIR